MSLVKIENLELKKRFSDIEFVEGKRLLGGKQMIVKFSNNYGASIVSHKGSMGGKDEFELAVLDFSGENWSLTYDTPITNDVIGYMSQDEVFDVLKQIQQL